MPGGMPPVDLMRYRHYAETVPHCTGDSRTAIIVRSLFIVDMIHGRLIVDEVPEETLRPIFGSSVKPSFDELYIRFTF
jgi:hypothetical protein